MITITHIRDTIAEKDGQRRRRLASGGIEILYEVRTSDPAVALSLERTLDQLSNATSGSNPILQSLLSNVASSIGVDPSTLTLVAQPPSKKIETIVVPDAPAHQSTNHTNTTNMTSTRNDTNMTSTLNGTITEEEGSPMGTSTTPAPAAAVFSPSPGLLARTKDTNNTNRTNEEEDMVSSEIMEEVLQLEIQIIIGATIVVLIGIISGVVYCVRRKKQKARQRESATRKIQPALATNASGHVDVENGRLLFPQTRSGRDLPPLPGGSGGQQQALPKKMILLRKVRDLQLQLSQAENPIARSKVRIEIAEIMERIKVINNEGNTARGEEKTMSGQQQQQQKQGKLHRPRGAASFMIRSGEIDKERFQSNIQTHQMEHHKRLVSRLRDMHRTKSTRLKRKDGETTSILAQRRRASISGGGGGRGGGEHRVNPAVGARKIHHHSVHRVELGGVGGGGAHPLTGGGGSGGSGGGAPFQSLLSRGRTLRASAPLFTAEDGDLDLDGDGVVDDEEKKIGVIARRTQASNVAFTKKMNEKRKTSVSRLQLRLEARAKARDSGAKSGTTTTTTRVLPTLPAESEA